MYVAFNVSLALLVREKIKALGFLIKGISKFRRQLVVRLDQVQSRQIFETYQGAYVSIVFSILAESKIISTHLSFKRHD